MLISSHRHTASDLEHWTLRERQDAVYAQLPSLSRKIERATGVMAAFVAKHPRSYLSVSWGKDSAVIAGMGARAGLPLPFVWVRVEPMFNPDCLATRDAFLRQFPAVRYEEVVVPCLRGADGEWLGTGRLEQGFRECGKRYGDAYISGVRGDESGTRKRRMVACGTDTKNTCAPIGWWHGEDVFAYLYAHGLPVHPAYAMTRGGLWDRNRVRVATIGGSRGVGFGRAEWELTYYSDVLRTVYGSTSVNAICGSERGER